MKVNPIIMNAEFIKKDKGEFILGIPSSEIVWKRYVLTKVSLNENALIASATKQYKLPKIKTIPAILDFIFLSPKHIVKIKH